MDDVIHNEDPEVLIDGVVDDSLADDILVDLGTEDLLDDDAPIEDNYD